MDSRGQARCPFSTPDAQVHLDPDPTWSVRMQTQPKLWIVISRPDRLPNALVASDALRERFPGVIHLLREQSKWWKNATWQEFVSEFASMHPFPNVRTFNGSKDRPPLYRDKPHQPHSDSALP